MLMIVDAQKKKLHLLTGLWLRFSDSLQTNTSVTAVTSHYVLTTGSSRHVTCVCHWGYFHWEHVISCRMVGGGSDFVLLDP